MSLNEVRDKLHLLIDEINDEYVLRGFYRALLREGADAQTDSATTHSKSATNIKVTRPGKRNGLAS